MKMSFAVKVAPQPKPGRQRQPELAPTDLAWMITVMRPLDKRLDQNAIDAVKRLNPDVPAELERIKSWLFSKGH
jgi:hypothetical protein